MRTTTAFLLGLLALARPAAGQASLAPEDQSDIDVMVAGQTETYTIIRDSFNRNQFYYVPRRPRLSERTMGGRVEPEFDLVRYQVNDPANPEQQIAKGILQFAVTLAPPQGVLPQLTSRIAERTGLSEASIRLSALPFKRAEAVIYTPSGNLLTLAPQTSGVASQFATQTMVFSAEVSQLGADVYDALTTQGSTGVPVVITMTYGALTAPTQGVRITVNWRNAFEHYSRNTQWHAQYARLGLFGVSASSESLDVLNRLQQDNAIRIEVNTGEGLSLADADKIIQPVLQRINAELLAVMAPPPAIPPAAVQNTGGSSPFSVFKAGYHTSTKRVEDVRTGSETFDFRIRSYVERVTVAGGFMGLGAYPAEVRATHVFFVPPGRWDNVVAGLPVIGDERLGVQAVESRYSLQLPNGTRVGQQQAFSWAPGTGWSRLAGTATARLVRFPVAGFGVSDADRPNLQLVGEHTLRRSGFEPLVVRTTQPASNGESWAVAPNEFVRTVVIDATEVAWRGIETGGRLSQVSYSVEVDGATVATGSLRAATVNGQKVPPAPRIVLVPAPNGTPRVTLHLTYVDAEGRTTPSPLFDNRVLNEIRSDLYVLIPRSDAIPPQ